jgi:hypothetical protein
MKKLFAVLLAWFSVTQLSIAVATPPSEKWQYSNPAVSVKVSPTADASVYLVSAKIVDLETGSTIVEPRLLAVLGSEAKFRVGTSDNQSSSTVTVSIDKDKNEFTYSSELIKLGKLAGRNVATFSLARQN